MCNAKSDKVLTQHGNDGVYKIQVYTETDREQILYNYGKSQHSQTNRVENAVHFKQCRISIITLYKNTHITGSSSDRNMHLSLAQNS